MSLGEGERSLVKNDDTPKSDRRHTWLEFSFSFHESVKVTTSNYTAWFCLIKAIFHRSNLTFVFDLVNK